MPEKGALQSSRWSRRPRPAVPMQRGGRFYTTASGKACSNQEKNLSTWAPQLTHDAASLSHVATHVGCAVATLAASFPRIDFSGLSRT